LSAIAALLWISLFAIVYHYALYPFALALLARIAGGRAPSALPGELPDVALIVAAFNEERVIEAKVRDCLALDYPPGKLRIIVCADGSTDRTAELVRGFADARVVCLHEPERRGKGAALNRAVAAAQAEFLVLSDANNFFSRDAIQRLLAPFAAAHVGGVTGAKRIFESAHRAAAQGDGLYWRYESSIKASESALGGTVTADGEMFALRRALYVPIPRAVVNDDLYLTLRLVERGYRVLYEPAATAHEEGSFTIGEDFRVKVRMAAGGFSTLFADWRTVFLSGAFTFKFISHKLLRWFMPLFLLGALLGSAALAGQWFYALLFGIQVACYALAAIGWWLNARGVRPGLFYVPFYFAAMNAAMAGGLLRFLRGGQSALWSKAQR
jgi:cellulose synthase/poly-beta-1,6-N-acetylglucosamine synthase-like glycosyltransferase